MKHRAENSKIDALTRTRNIVAVKKEIAKYGKADATQDTLFLLPVSYTHLAAHAVGLKHVITFA